MKKQSTKKRAGSEATKGGNAKPPKVTKPHADFPLWPHPSGRWCKKVRGRAIYFGKTSDDPNGTRALERWIADRDYLLAGKTPPGDKTALTVGDLANLYLEARDADVNAGELTVDAFECYRRTAKRLIETFGRRRQVIDLGPEDFRLLRTQLAKEYSPTTLTAEIARTRAFFNWAVKDERVDRVRFGDALRAPSARTLLVARNASPAPMLEKADLRRIIDAAPNPLKACVLLGINAAFGPHDVATLPRDAVDLDGDGGWVAYPRPKTGVARRCPLWPETAKAIREALANRPKPVNSEHDYLAFLDPAGMPIKRVGLAFRRHLEALKLYQPKLGLYTLRRIFRTVADEVRDWPAIDLVMGHSRAPGDMGAVYRQTIDDSRLQTVVARVHDWLYDDAADDDQGDAPDVVPFSRMG